MEAKPMCERCEKETLETIDIWVQGHKYWMGDLGDPENGPNLEVVDEKTFELNGRDYIIICEPCWEIIRTTTWAALCEATTTDHKPTYPHINDVIKGFQAVAKETHSPIQQVAGVWLEKLYERLEETR
jgi:hypothetical protein